MKQTKSTWPNEPLKQAQLLRQIADEIESGSFIIRQIQEEQEMEYRDDFSCFERSSYRSRDVEYGYSVSLIGIKYKTVPALVDLLP